MTMQKMKRFGFACNGRAAHGRICTYLLVAAALGSNGVAADEGGVAFWFSGQYSSFAAVPVSPGWSMPIQGYYYDGSVSANKELKRGNLLTAGLNTTVPLLMVQPTYAPETKVLGGQLALAPGFGWGNSSADANLSVSDVPNELHRRDSETGFTDLYPIASLAWTDGNDNWMAYVTGDIPVGDYDPDRLANLGIGHGAIDAGGLHLYKPAGLLVVRGKASRRGYGRLCHGFASVLTQGVKSLVVCGGTIIALPP